MNLKKDAQVPVSIALRTAVWNWIELCDDEYSDALRYHRRLDGAPERVFDLLYDLQEGSRDKSGAWPTLAVLLSISGDRMKGEYEANALVGQRGAFRKVRRIHCGVLVPAAETYIVGAQHHRLDPQELGVWLEVLRRCDGLCC